MTDLEENNLLDLTSHLSKAAGSRQSLYERDSAEATLSPCSSY